MNQVFSGLLSTIVFVDRPGELPPDGSLQRWSALIPVAASIGLPLLALYLLIRELTVFYFTARPFRRGNSRTQYPRFVLSGILVSKESLSNENALSEARDDSYVRDLLVPAKDHDREVLLSEAHTMGQLREFTTASKFQDIVLDDLKTFSFEQTGSDPRSLAEEAAKMEASLARHQKYLRSLVLRYAKAFLLTILTTVVTVSASGTLSLLTNPLTQGHVNGGHVWLALLLIYSIWCGLAIYLVRRPVEWIYAGVPTNERHRTPQSLLSFERWTLVVAFASQLLLFANLVVSARDMRDPFQSGALAAGLVCLTFSGVVLGLTVRSERDITKRSRRERERAPGSSRSPSPGRSRPHARPLEWP